MNPEKLIDFQLNDDNVKLIRNSSIQDDEIDRTILLIWEVFNRKNTGMRVYKSAMRFKALRTEMSQETSFRLPGIGKLYLIVNLEVKSKGIHIYVEV